MSKPIDNGGNAFPEHHYFDGSRGQYGMHMTASDVGCGGMSLRDAAALAVAPQCISLCMTADACTDFVAAAKAALEFADAFIAARKEKP